MKKIWVVFFCLLLAKAFSENIPFTMPPPNLPVIVEARFYFDDLIYIEDKSELFTGLVTFMFKWHDPRLAYTSETDFPKTYMESAAEEKLKEIWWPQIKYINSDFPPAYDNRSLFIFPDGTVRYIVGITGKFRSIFNFANFPFDKQTLKINVTSFLWNKDIVQFIVSPTHASYSKDMSILREANVLSLSESTKYEEFGPTLFFESEKNKKFSVFEIAITVQRKFGFYIYQVFLPLLIVLGISFAAYFEFTQSLIVKVAFTLTAFLVFVAAKFAINQDLPRIEYMTVIDRVFVLCYICFAINAFLIVLEMVLRRKHAKKARTINNNARWIVPLIFVVAFALIIFYAVK